MKTCRPTYIHRYRYTYIYIYNYIDIHINNYIDIHIYIDSQFEACRICSAKSSSGRQEQLVNVRRIVASRVAFAALLEDGRVVSWGGLEGVGHQQVQDGMAMAVPAMVKRWILCMYILYNII